MKQDRQMSIHTNGDRSNGKETGDDDDDDAE